MTNTVRIALNLSLLGRRMTGVGQFALELARALPHQNSNVEWVFFGCSVPDLLPTADNVRIVPVPAFSAPRRIAWEQFELPLLVSRVGVNGLHCPDFSRPLLGSSTVATTLHDLSFYAGDAYFSFPKRIYKQVMTRASLLRSAAVVTVSEFTRGEIVRHFGMEPNAVRVIHPGVTPFPPGEKEKACDPYILFVGTLESRKNIVQLIHAYGQLRRTTGFPHHLVLAGKPGFGWQLIRHAIQHSPYSGDIEVRGYVDRTELARLYRNSDLFVFPSTYEGFGLPVLEAMSVGAPVVCSGATSIPEVAGDAAQYFDCQSSEDLALAMIRVLESHDLRHELISRGFRQASRFSWDRCARLYCEMYREVFG